MPRYKDRTFSVAIHLTAPPFRSRVEKHTNKRAAIRAARRGAKERPDGSADVRLTTSDASTLIYQCRNQDGRVVVEEL